MTTVLTKIEIEKAGQFAGHGAAIFTLESACNAHLFYSGSSDNLIVEWNLKDQQQSKVIARLPAKAMALKYVPDKNLLLVGQSAGGIHVIDLNKPQRWPLPPAWWRFTRTRNFRTMRLSP